MQLVLHRQTTRGLYTLSEVRTDSRVDTLRHLVLAALFANLPTAFLLCRACAETR